MAYVDTSVLVAYYCPEPLSGAAQEAILGIDEPAISPLTEVEFCSAVATKVRTREVARDAAERLLSRFRLHLEEQRFRLLPVETAQYLLAADWIGRFATPLRTLDALHLATAFTSGLPLLTADGDLARSAEHFGVECTFIS